MMRMMVAALAVALTLAAGARADDAAGKEVAKALAALNEAFSKQDTDAARRLMTADHVAVTPYYGGPVGRDEQLRSVKDLKLKEYSAGKAKVKMLGKDAALITYPLILKGTFRGKAVDERNFASAVWVRQGGEWREAFYQETALGGE
jgi:hypothetical protein